MAQNGQQILFVFKLGDFKIFAFKIWEDLTALSAEKSLMMFFNNRCLWFCGANNSDAIAVLKLSQFPSNCLCEQVFSAYKWKNRARIDTECGLILAINTVQLCIYELGGGKK